MYVKKIIIDRLISDTKFREELAEKLGVSGRAIFNQAKRYLSSPLPDSLFTRITVINYFKENGYLEEQILTENLSAE